MRCSTAPGSPAEPGRALSQGSLRLRDARSIQELPVVSLRERAASVLSTLSGVVETYYCQICLSNCPMSDGFRLQACGHIFCRECLCGYLGVRIREAAIEHLPCPFLPSEIRMAPDRCSNSGSLLSDGALQDPTPACSGGTAMAIGGLDSGCAAEITEEDVHAIVGPELHEKLERFRLMRSDQTYRECPRCSTPVLGGTARRPTLVCGQCSFGFCFVHANAHPGQTCRQYERARREEERTAAAAIAAFARPCPGCNMRITRTGGCNHMTCSRCQTDFCWLCGRGLGHQASATPVHYAWWNVFGCPGLQMHGCCFECCPRGCVTFLMCFYRIIFVPMFLVFLAIWGVIIVLVSVVSVIYYPVICCAKFVCCCPIKREWFRLPCSIALAPSEVLCEDCCSDCSDDCCGCLDDDSD